MGRTDRGGRNDLRCASALGHSSGSHGMCSACRNVQGAPSRSRGPGRTGRGSGRRSQPQSIPERPQSGVQGEAGAQLQGSRSGRGDAERPGGVGTEGGAPRRGRAPRTRDPHPSPLRLCPRSPAQPPACAPSPGPSRSPGTPGGCSTVLGWLRIPVSGKQEAGIRK